jgi:hypothetical protein
LFFMTAFLCVKSECHAVAACATWQIYEVLALYSLASPGFVFLGLYEPRF